MDSYGQKGAVAIQREHRGLPGSWGHSLLSFHLCDGHRRDSLGQIIESCIFDPVHFLRCLVYHNEELCKNKFTTDIMGQMEVRDERKFSRYNLYVCIIFGSSKK